MTTHRAALPNPAGNPASARAGEGECRSTLDEPSEERLEAIYSGEPPIGVEERAELEHRRFKR